MLEIKNKVKLEFHNWTETFSALNDLERKCRVLSYGTSGVQDIYLFSPPPSSLVSNSKSVLSVPFSQLTLLKNTPMFCANLKLGKRQKKILKHNN